MNLDNVRTAIETVLATVTGLPPLQTENTRYEIAGRTTPWARATLIPTEPSPMAVGHGSLVQFAGITQIDLFYPKESGTADANTMADAIAAVFPRGPMTVSFDGQLVVQMVWQDAATVMDSWYVVPVSIRWSMYATVA